MNDPDNNKGQWTYVSSDEIKLYYGIVLMMEIIKCDRDETYFKAPTGAHFMLGTNIPDVITKDRFFQIRRYLHFNDDDKEHDPNDKLFKVPYIRGSI